MRVSPHRYRHHRIRRKGLRQCSPISRPNSLMYYSDKVCYKSKGATESLSIVFTPILVVSGRSKQSPGNVWLRKIVNDNISEYVATTRRGKTAIVQRTIAMVHARSGRFLRKKEGTMEWEEVSPDEAREKVGKLFRQARDRR